MLISKFSKSLGLNTRFKTESNENKICNIDMLVSALYCFHWRCDGGVVVAFSTVQYTSNVVNVNIF